MTAQQRRILLLSGISYLAARAAWASDDSCQFGSDDEASGLGDRVDKVFSDIKKTLSVAPLGAVGTGMVVGVVALGVGFSAPVAFVIGVGTFAAVGGGAIVRNTSRNLETIEQMTQEF